MIIALALALQAHTLENLTPRDLPQDTIAGLRLGESQAEATARLHEISDSVVERPGDLGGTEFVAGHVQMTICRGNVVSVVVELEDFHMFATIAEAMTHVYGPAIPDPMAFAGARPATDPRGALTMSFAAIRLRWRRAPTYLLGYTEISGERRAFESLTSQINPCHHMPN